MMKRLRIPLLTAGGVVLCAFVLIPMAFDTLDIGPEIVEVSKSKPHPDGGGGGELCHYGSCA